jgi:protein-S-isoprenylcysteine O-methyltransferase Ste14
MSHIDAPAYGLWSLVIVNSAIFIIFAFSFLKPQTKHDWRSFGAFSAFIVALFVEMYGFPLTIFVLAGWLQKRAPGIDLLSHDAGHLWQTIFDLKGNPHIGWMHIGSTVLIIGGFWLLAAAWPVLYRAQKAGQLATQGIYARLRHPQYVGFVLIMFGFLLQWPTLVTLMMFPVLVFMYARLGRNEERQAEAEFGTAWRDYAAHTRRVLPRLGHWTRPSAARGRAGA